MRVRPIAFVALFVALFVAGGALVMSLCTGERTAEVAGPRSGSDAAPRVRIREQWRVALSAPMVGLPAADQAGVVVTAGESHVVAISPQGDEQWRVPVAGALANAPRLDRDLVVVATNTAVVALRRDDGTTAWSVPTTTTEAPNRANRPVVVGDTVIATAADGLVFGADRTSGVVRWRTTLPTATTAEPAAGDGPDTAAVAVVVGIGAWHGFDAATGTPLWSADLGLFGTSSPVVYRDGLSVLAAVASDERVRAVDARSGAARWSSAAEQSELYQVPVVAANGSELLVADHWGRLAAFDPHDGRRLWSVHGADTVAQFGEPVLLDRRLVALPLDARGPRIGSPAGSVRLDAPSDGHGVAELPLRGLVVTTWGGATNYVLLYDVGYH